MFLLKVMVTLIFSVNRHLIHDDFFQLSFRSTHSNQFLFFLKLSLQIFMHLPVKYCLVTSIWLNDAINSNVNIPRNFFYSVPRAITPIVFVKMSFVVHFLQCLTSTFFFYYYFFLFCVIPINCRMSHTNTLIGIMKNTT